MTQSTSGGAGRRQDGKNYNKSNDRGGRGSKRGGGRGGSTAEQQQQVSSGPGSQWRDAKDGSTQ